MKTLKLRWRFAETGVAIAMILSLSLMAAASSLQPGVGLQPFAPASLDDGSLDVGAEYPSADAPGTVDDRPIHKDSAWNFYNAMRGAGYTGGDNFIWGNANAWETDWKRAALGGDENNWVDNVDIMFIHSHGNYNATTGVGSVWFPYGHTDTNLVPNDCLASWGDRDVEWIGIKTCLSLRDLGWASCMNGVHLIAGFTTLSASAEFGGHWADQLLGWQWLGIWFRQPKTVTQAWFTACDSQTDGAIARVIAEDVAHFNDKVWNRGGPVYGDVVNWPKYYIDHSCYKAAPMAVDVSVLATMPSQRVLDRKVTPESAAALAATLGLTGTPSLSPDGSEYALSDGTRTLSVLTATGGYQYQDASQLWVPPTPGQPLNLPDPRTAGALANNFFRLNAMALPGGQNFDAASQHVARDQMATLANPAAVRAASPEAPEDVDVMVAYGRSLTATAGTAAGDAIAVNISVSGPGSATKMYLGGQGTAPIGLSGGSRDVQAGNQVTLKDAESSWAAFLKDPQLSILEFGVEYDSIERVGAPTFAYFEQPLSIPQQELIPSWVYDVNFLKGGQPPSSGRIYVPASPLYYPPEVTIDSPAANATFAAGTVIGLTSTVTGNGPFTYQWSSSAQGVLGAAEDIKTMLLNNVKPGDKPAPVALSLLVTDANGLARASSVTINVVGQPVWLPSLQR